MGKIETALILAGSKLVKFLWKEYDIIYKLTSMVTSLIFSTRPFSLIDSFIQKCDKEEQFEVGRTWDPYIILKITDEKYYL